MKKIIILFIFSISTYAGYFSVNNGVVDTSKTCVVKKLCGDNTVFVPNEYDHNFWTLQDELASDFDKPIYSEPSEAELCQAIELDVDNGIEGKTKEQDCVEKLAAKSCGLDFIADSDADKVFCKKVIGYEQKLTGEKILAIDETKKAAYEAEQAAIKIAETKRALSKKKIAFGAVMIEDYNIMRSENQLSTSDSLLMLNKFRDLLGLAQGGQIAPARNVLAAIEVDAFFTQKTKDAFLSKIDAFLATI